MSDWVRRRLTRLFNAIWYGGNPLGWLLWPVALLYRTAVAVRLALYRRGVLRAVDSGVPVVVVGNITVGGTGKTPCVLWLAEALAKRGLSVGIVTRGYGGRAREWPQWVTRDSDPGQVGDEPVLLAQRTNSPVAAGPDRVAAAKNLLDRRKVDVLLADDGLQHYRLARCFEVAVVDGLRGLGNGLCLPAGPLREPVARLGSVDAIIVNSGDRRLYQPRGRPPGAGADTHVVSRGDGGHGDGGRDDEGQGDRTYGDRGSGDQEHGGGALGDGRQGDVGRGDEGKGGRGRDDEGQCGRAYGDRGRGDREHGGGALGDRRHGGLGRDDGGWRKVFSKRHPGVAKSGDLRHGEVYRAALAPVRVVRLTDGVTRDLADFRDSEVHAVAGIGHPERFFALLERSGITVDPRPLVDHAIIREPDLSFDDAAPVLITEKDAVKCRGFAPGNVWAVIVDLAFEGDDGDRLMELVMRRIGIQGEPR